MTVESTALSNQERAKHMLLELNIPANMMGYKQLCFAIPLFATDKDQVLTTELYPAVAKHFRIRDWRAVENSIRRAIRKGWKNGNPDIWRKYFPNQKEPPSNWHFIATLAEYLE